jgi:hypothetical protein
MITCEKCPKHGVALPLASCSVTGGPAHSGLIIGGNEQKRKNFPIFEIKCPKTLIFKIIVVGSATLSKVYKSKNLDNYFRKLKNSSFFVRLVVERTHIWPYQPKNRIF